MAGPALVGVLAHAGPAPDDIAAAATFLAGRSPPSSPATTSRAVVAQR